MCMDIHTAFFNALSSKPDLRGGVKANCLLGNIYKFPRNVANYFLTVYSGGEVSCAPPFSYDFRSFDYYMLLYTKSGQGKLSAGGKCFKLDGGSLLFFDCRQPFKLGIDKESWDFAAFFFDGPNAQYYYRYIASPVTNIENRHDIEKNFVLLLHNKRTPEVQNKFLDNCYLTNILTLLCICENICGSAEAPAADYAMKVKSFFDQSYFKEFSLQYFEDTLGVSKYSLCHEFTKQFGVPPFRYLTNKRIDTAKKLLLMTNMEVHDVGSAVGIKNTNHFINLFKKYTNKTPMAFRQSSAKGGTDA